MFEKFYPDQMIDSVYDVDYKRLYEEGCRAVIYDIDNTLVLHDAPANAAAVGLFDRIREAGLQSCLLSNNHEKRVKSFADAVHADVYIFDAHKPAPGSYRKITAQLGLETGQAVFFGDQLFTDVLGARNAGIKSVLVRPIGPEKLLRIKLKRILEKPVLRAFLRSGQNRPL